MELENQHEILRTALKIAGYNAIADLVLSNIDLSTESNLAIRTMAYHMATFNHGNPDAAEIIQTVLNAGWDAIGISDLDPLDSEDRENIVDAIIAASKSILAAEAARLQALTLLPT